MTQRHYSIHVHSFFHSHLPGRLFFLSCERHSLTTPDLLFSSLSSLTELPLICPTFAFLSTQGHSPGYIFIYLFVCFIFLHLLLYSCLACLNRSLRNHIHFHFLGSLFCLFAIMQYALYKFMFYKQLLNPRSELPNPTPLNEDATLRHTMFL